MGISSTKISELLCTKFCHDLAGPIGAVNNGIDFFESENKQMQEKAIALVKLSSMQAVNRMTYYRQAYGMVSEVSPAHLTDLKALILRYVDDSKVALDFPDHPSQLESINARCGKLLLNMVIIASSSMLNSGVLRVNIRRVTEDVIHIATEAETTLYKVEEDLRNILSGNAENVEINSRNIQQYYTAILADELRTKIELQEEEGKLTLSVQCQNIV